MDGDPKQFALLFESMATISWQVPAVTFGDEHVRDAARKLAIVLNERLATTGETSAVG